MLTAVYGDCRVNHQFPWPADSDAYLKTPVGNLLKRIRGALGDFRGQRDFIKSARLPPCDFFISDPLFILEFDESQHFTFARLTTLDQYPANSALGFPLSRWRELCREIGAKDDQPIDRDERRAWYDVLRDLVPIIHGFKPTVRLYAEEYAWCSLDANSARDVATIQELLRQRLPMKTS